MGIDYKGSQSQTERAVALWEEEEYVAVVLKSLFFFWFDKTKNFSALITNGPCSEPDEWGQNLKHSSILILCSLPCINLRTRSP